MTWPGWWRRRWLGVHVVKVGEKVSHSVGIGTQELFDDGGVQGDLVVMLGAAEVEVLGVEGGFRCR